MLPQFKESAEQHEIGEINGPPADETIYDDENLLDYLKLAHKNGSLAYCR